jgi:hypothetical protein
MAGRFTLFIFIVFRLGTFGVSFCPKRFGALGRSENENPFSTPTWFSGTIINGTKTHPKCSKTEHNEYKQYKKASISTVSSNEDQTASQ